MVAIAVDDADADIDVLMAGAVLAVVGVLFFIAAAASRLQGCVWKALVHVPLRRLPFDCTFSARAAYGEMLAAFASQSDPIADAAKARVGGVQRRHAALPVVDEEAAEESGGVLLPTKALTGIQMWCRFALVCFSLHSARG